MGMTINESITELEKARDSIEPYLFMDEAIDQSMKTAIETMRKYQKQERALDKIRTEIAEYGSIWVEYKITGRRDKDIEQLVSDVLSQAKKQVLEVIDKYKADTEAEDGNDD